MFRSRTTLIALIVSAACFAVAANATQPNIVIIFTDDLGYGDLGCYGHPTIRTPYLDQMAAEGIRFTDFYVAAPICTPSRAALLTGRYPARNGMTGGRGVLFPDCTGGLPDEEITIAELMQGAGYATAHIGKWHLGIHEGSRPGDQGFEYSYWLPYSNDMDGVEGLPKGAGKLPDPPEDGWNVPLLRGNKIIERPVDQTTITKRYTEEAIGFIRENRSRPFFLYLAHTMPHIPLFASKDFQGKSRRGIYGDVVEEIDWSVGQVLDALRELELDGNTLVFFTSDNGPWLTQDLQGGSAGLLRDGKGGTWEGGMRVPAIAWWPGRIHPGVSNAFANSMDLLPTAAGLAGAEVPDDRPLDGIDIGPHLFDRAPLPDRAFFYYHRTSPPYACRLGEYKLFVKTQYAYVQREPETHNPPLLFHLGRDPGESHDIAEDHPEIVKKLLDAMDRHIDSFEPPATNLY